MYPSSTKVKQISVAIAGSSQLFREGLCQILRQRHFLVVEMGQSFEDALCQHDDGASGPELIILCLDRGDGALAQLELVRKYQAEPLGCHIVLLAESMDAVLVDRAMASGADALLSKDVSCEVLQRALELVCLGQQLFPASLIHARGDDHKSKPTVGMIPLQESSRVPVPLDQQTTVVCSDPGSIDQHCSSVLSMRESQVLRCVAAGASNKMIARELNIAEVTVKTHVKALLRKLRLNNRTQIAMWAMINS